MDESPPPFILPKPQHQKPHVHAHFTLVRWKSTMRLYSSDTALVPRNLQYGHLFISMVESSITFMSSSLVSLSMPHHIPINHVLLTGNTYVLIRGSATLIEPKQRKILRRTVLEED
ncbi:hypothetical protein PsorP6_003624 [Peronosclerospora sorghi]|uniref:Uncharacterized protein n=1 Tax=Peronosclerospora sorghi TaxID=230839 RepID=A0ACC0VNA2_9STRA|nr:hypothetical protein PsorP6_003624 [Peronosclerospora sorghi]